MDRAVVAGVGDVKFEERTGVIEPFFPIAIFPPYLDRWENGYIVDFPPRENGCIAISPRLANRGKMAV